MLPLVLPLLWAGSLAQRETNRLTIQESVTVQEGLCVFVSCFWSYPRINQNYAFPTYGYWFRKGANTKLHAVVATNKRGHKVQEETQGRFHLVGDPQTYNCSLDIRDAQRRDTGTYFFRVEQGSSVRHSYMWNQLSVNVTVLTLMPDIHIPGNLESGRPTNLTCSVPWACGRGTPPLFSWTSAAHTALGPRTHLSSVLTLTPRPQDDGSTLTCQVHFPAVGVTVERTIQLNVTCAPQNPAIGVCPEDGSGEPETRRGVVLGAAAGAAVTAVLAVCLCVTYFLAKRTCRTAEGMDDTHTALAPTPLGHQETPKVDHPADPTWSAETSPTLEAEPELYYASISFQKTSAPQKRTDPVYAKIEVK